MEKGKRYMVMTLPAKMRTRLLLLLCGFILGCHTISRTWRQDEALQIMMSNIDEFRSFLKKSPGWITTKNTDGVTLLMVAAQENKIGHAQLLLEMGAPIMAKTKVEGVTALHLARTTEMVTLLLSHGANIDAMASSGTPLMTCMVYAYDVRGVSKTLIENGADVNVDADGGITPLMMAISMGSEYSDLVELILKGNADVNKKTVNGNTVMHQCANGGDVAISTIKLLIMNGGNVLMRNNEGDTPLSLAQQNMLNAPTDKQKLIVGLYKAAAAETMR